MGAGPCLGRLGWVVGPVAVTGVAAGVGWWEKALWECLFLTGRVSTGGAIMAASGFLRYLLAILKAWMNLGSVRARSVELKVAHA